MTDKGDIYKRIRREGITEEKVRALDASEIVEWIHRLEDQIDHLEKTIKEMTKHD